MGLSGSPLFLRAPIIVVDDDAVYFMVFMKCTCKALGPILLQIEDNSGVSLDSLSTPLLPEFMPPLMRIFPWVAKVSS